MLRQPGKKTNDIFSNFIILALTVFLISGHYSYAEAANSPEEKRILILDSFQILKASSHSWSEAFCVG